jgi:hypothetical protein
MFVTLGTTPEVGEGGTGVAVGEFTDRLLVCITIVLHSPLSIFPLVIS